MQIKLPIQLLLPKHKNIDINKINGYILSTLYNKLKKKYYISVKFFYSLPNLYFFKEPSY